MILTPLQKLPKNVEIWANLLLPNALNGCPKCKKSPNLVTLFPWFCFLPFLNLSLITCSNSFLICSSSSTVLCINVYHSFLASLEISVWKQFYLSPPLLTDQLAQIRLGLESVEYLSCEDKVLNEGNFQNLSKTNANCYNHFLHLLFAVFFFNVQFVSFNHLPPHSNVRGECSRP